MVVFFEGDEVKVCSKEEGFLGSYYEAKILYPLRSYTLSTDEVRPMPPPATITRATQVFHYLDRMDAFDNDGWWNNI
ncbi:hypothetical protein Gohar_000194 [Gossypium harknessii]|uniref:Agenet-like domain-containing protein n=1 Tax=Gossypium harknessii TaxID=34285 RepID=A0A7J9HZW3_9ROSI|nr:hypothetical protein [Gossypium harknessii]